MKASDAARAARLVEMLGRMTKEQRQFGDPASFPTPVRVEFGYSSGSIRNDEGRDLVQQAIWNAIEIDCEDIRRQLREIGVTEFDV